MLERLLPFQFDKPVGAGRTEPARLTCEDQQGQIVEVVAKLSGSCNRGIASLALEGVAALLAGDLGLPVPQAYVVELEPEWVATISDPAWALTARRSSPAAFGSRALSGGYSDWIVGTPLVGRMVQTAAAIFVFDAITDNADRRDGNPNCLVRGEDIRIIDHELAFPDTRGIIGWRPPWSVGGLHHMETPGAHIFTRALARREVDWEAIADAWRGLSDARLGEYGAAMPPEWIGANAIVAAALDTIRNARDNIDECITEVRRLLR